MLGTALDAGIKQHALLTAERDIMERTLAAVVKTLCDVLSLAEPQLFERAALVKSYVSQVVRHCQLEGGWQIEVAASLHTLGLIALPTEFAHRAESSVPLTVDEAKLLASHPDTARRILEVIPRLENVALIVGQQAVEPSQGPEWVRQGARLLRLAMRVERRLSRAVSLSQALDALSPKATKEELTFLLALRVLCDDPARQEQRELRVSELQAGMTLDRDALARDGSLLLPKGRELSEVLIARLHQFAATRGLQEPLHVRILAPAA